MLRGSLLALVAAMGLPVTTQALPIITVGEDRGAPVERSRTWDGPGIGDLGMAGFELSIDFSTLASWDRDDVGAGLLGREDAENVGRAGGTATRPWVWLGAPETDLAF